MSEGRPPRRSSMTPSPDNDAPPQDMILGRDIELNAIPAEDGSDLAEFHQAAYTTQIEKIRKMLRKGEISDVNQRDAVGRTALHWAAASGSMELIHYLLENKARINATDRLGWTPLTMAALYGHDAAVRFLLSRGADAFRTDTQKATALHYACSQGHEAVVQALLTRGARVDAEDANKSTPLHYCGMLFKHLKSSANFIGSSYGISAMRTVIA